MSPDLFAWSFNGNETAFFDRDQVQHLSGKATIYLRGFVAPCVLPRTLGVACAGRAITLRGTSCPATSGHDDRLYLRRWEPAHSGLTLLALFLAVNPVAFGVTLRARDFSGEAL
jgi:hypothetical protein